VGVEVDQVPWVREEDQMRRFITWCFAISGVAAALALGTAGVSSAATTALVARGAAVTTAPITMLGGTDVVVAQNTFAAGGDQSGWHSHPGMVVVTVNTGEITLYSVTGGSCSVTTYHQGDTFVERPFQIQNGVNNGSATTIVTAVFFNVPHNGATRTDVADPGICPS
jgi:quercetin dioxygenase-like cupin family protein